MYNLKVKDFQRFKSLDMKIEGFCVIEGPSNLGKSSIRRALGVVSQNIWEANFVANGSKNTVINLEAEDIKIQATKGTSNEFIILKDGQKFEYKKAGKAIPKEVMDSGFSPLVIGKDSINLLMAKQYDPLFMVSYNDVMNTKILNTVFDVDVIEKANELVIKDIASSKRDLKFEVSLIEEKQKELEECEALLKKMKVLEEIYSKINLIDNYEDCSKELLEAEDSLSSSNDKMDKLNRLISIKEGLISSSQHEKKLKEYQSLDIKLKELETALNSLIPLYDNLCLLEDITEVYKEETDNLNESMYVADDLEKIERAENIYKSLSKLDKYQDIKTKYVNSALSILRISKAMQVIEIYEKLNRMEMLSFTKWKLKGKEDELDSVSKGISLQDEAIAEIGLCPCCGNDLHKD